MEPKRTLTVRMPASLHAGLKNLAHENKCSMEALVRALIEQALSNPKKAGWLYERSSETKKP